MAERDSWEDMDEGPAAAPAAASRPLPKLNPNAPTFTFNPGASTFTPTFAPKPAAAPAPAAVAVPAPVAPAQPAQPTPPPAAAAPAVVPSFNGVSKDSPAERDDEPTAMETGGEEAPATDGADAVAQEMEDLTVSAPDEAEGSGAAQEVGSPPEASAPAREPMDEAEDKRQHLNIVFIGHVDAGKSTIGGQILYLTGMVDERTISKYEREAKDKNRESWYMAYIMDTNEEERAKGKTVEVGRAHFETVKKRYTVLDAPGHRNYVPNMISGASQADVGVLVIAARKGEFETGFERGGQTREHAQLAKTLGVAKLLVVVNKMDDVSVNWGQERFDEIVSKLSPFLKTCGYNMRKDVQFLPISGIKGLNMKERMPEGVCPWFKGPCLFEALDDLDMPERDPNALFRMPLIDKYRDMGTVVMGKIESGSVRVGDTLLVMPNKVKVKVLTLMRDADEVRVARPGENLRVRLSGIEEEEISPGFVLSSMDKPIPAVLEFEAQIQILELLDHKAIFTAGYRAVLHLHSVVEECEIIALLAQFDPKTKKYKKHCLFVKSGAIVKCRIQVAATICVERFEDFPQLGRFTLRDEGKTVAIGRVISTGAAAGETKAE